MPTRRSLLRGIGASALAVAAPAIIGRHRALAAGGPPPLPHLPRIDATAANAFALTAVAGATEFRPGVPSPTMGFNRPHLGPVVRVRTGSRVSATVGNATGHAISAHWHGLLVPGEVDGGPHQPIAPGATWTPVLPVSQPPATLWYHTHLHGETAAGVHAGLAGVLIVEDGGDAGRGLPATADVDDLVLILQDKRPGGDGRAIYEPGEGDLMHGFLGSAVLVNGIAGAIATVPRGVVRLRLVNASNARNYDLGFDDGRPVVLVATDQGYLTAPIALDRLRLTPGERAELLVDFAGGGNPTLVSDPHAETAGTMPMGGMMHAMTPLPETFTAPFPVLAFAVDPSLPAAIRRMPAALDGDVLDAAAPSITRRFVLNDMGMPTGGGAMGGMGHMGGGGGRPAFSINGQSYDMGRMDAEIAAGTTERWLVSGQMMGHPFHIHGVRFLVESENGGAPRPENRGWKDTVFVEGEASLLVRFDQPAGRQAPFMFHCHILEHEDAGMMGQFTVA